MSETPATTAVADFLHRWEASGAAERANYQLFLSELCDLLNVPRPEPTQPDDRNNAYVFERAVTFRHGTGLTSAGRIDLYKRGGFILEAKQGRDRPGEEGWPLFLMVDMGHTIACFTASSPAPARPTLSRINLACSKAAKRAGTFPPYRDSVDCKALLLCPSGHR